jgi:hypothetical protein
MLMCYNACHNFQKLVINSTKFLKMRKQHSTTNNYEKEGEE